GARELVGVGQGEGAQRAGQLEHMGPVDRLVEGELDRGTRSGGEAQQPIDPGGHLDREGFSGARPGADDAAGGGLRADPETEATGAGLQVDPETEATGP